MLTILYRIYQLLIALPLILVATVLTSVITCLGGILGDAHFWGYYPGKLWSMFICRILLLPVKCEGEERLAPGASYIFVANHQGAFDIFLIYGFLCRNFRWMMKKELRHTPFIGIACEKAGHIFVDRGSRSGLKDSLSQCKATLSGGTSLVVFPEGSRTLTGKMRPFKKGAFILAQDLELPIVPVTLNGPFHVLPRQKGINFVRRATLSITYHDPIPTHAGMDLQPLMDQARQAINTSLTNEFQDQ